MKQVEIEGQENKLRPYFTRDEYLNETLTRDDIFIQVVDDFMPHLTKKNEFGREWIDAKKHIWGVITTSDLAFCITFITGNYDHWEQQVDFAKRNMELPTGEARVAKWYGGNECLKERVDYTKQKEKFDDQLEEKIPFGSETITREDYLGIVYRKHRNKQDEERIANRSIHRNDGTANVGKLSSIDLEKIKMEEEVKRKRRARENWDFKSKKSKVVVPV